MNDKRLKRNSLGYYEIANKPSQNDLQSFYSEKYYQDGGKGAVSYEKLYDDEELKYINLKIGQRFSIAQKLLKVSNGKFLDVGCGKGFSLKHYFDLGWEVKGIDFSKTAIMQHNPDMVDKVEFGDVYFIISSLIKKNKKYDIITLDNVLEHVLEPIDFLENLKKIISNDGILILVVPNDASLIQEYCFNRNLINERFWICPPDHLSYFNYDSLIALGEHTGYDCKNIIADFPIDYFLLNPHSNYVLNKSVGKDAHRARIRAELLLSEKNNDDVLSYYHSLAKVGLGRDLTAFFSLEQ